MKKIAFVFPLLTVMGGAQRYILALANFLSENGYPVKIYTLYASTVLSSYIGDKVELISLFEKSPNKFFQNMLNPMSLVLTWRLSKKILDYDVLITSIWPSGMTTFFLAKSKPHKTYFNICFEPNYLVHRYEPIRNTTLDFSHRNYLARVAFFLMIPILSTLSILDKLSMKAQTKVLTLSQFVKKQVKDVFGPEISNKTFADLFDYVDFSKFHDKKVDVSEIKKKYSIKEGFDYVLFTVSRLEKTKKVDIIIHALNELKKKDVNCLLLIGGVGSFADFLYKKVCEANLLDNVIFLGYLNDDDLLEIYNFSDIFIYAGNVETSGPLTILEAMACKTPVICAASGGPLEIIDDNVNGLLFRVNDSIDLRDKIIQLTSEIKENSAILGENGNKYCLNFHGIERLGRIVIDLIN